MNRTIFIFKNRKNRYILPWQRRLVLLATNNRIEFVLTYVCVRVCFPAPPGTQRAAVRALPHGARHRERLERHGAHLAVCLLQGAAADLL